jgi:hypothetical protein
MLSEECNKVEVITCTLKRKELVNKEEIPSLESTILELRKEIAIETVGQQDLLVKKSKAEVGMYGYEKQRSLVVMVVVVKFMVFWDVISCTCIDTNVLKKLLPPSSGQKIKHQVPQKPWYLHMNKAIWHHIPDDYSLHEKGSYSYIVINRRRTIPCFDRLEKKITKPILYPD